MKTSDLIEDLSKNALPVKPQGPLAVFFKWALLSAAYLAVMLLISGIRIDISEKLHEPLFMAELLSLLLLSLTVGIAAIMLSYPDGYQLKYFIYLPVIPLALFIAVLCVEANSQTMILPHKQEEMLGCFLCICGFSIVPALLLFRQLMRNASTRPRLASAFAVLAAFSFGALTIRICEQVDNMAHIIAVHYVPLVFLSGIGLLIGRKLLKW